MRLSLCSALSTLLFVLLGTSAGIRLDIDVFVDMILSARKFHSGTSIIFAHPGDKYKDCGDLSITHLMHASSRLLNRRYIITANVYFKKLRASLEYYHQIGHHPVIVVIIPKFEAYLEFAEVTKTYPMSVSTWIVLFLYTPDNGTHDYCREPIGNPFNLVFNTEMLVSCHNEVILREWYSVKGETVNVHDLAKWIDGDRRFVLLTNLSLYDRRKDLEGIVLRTTVKELLVLTDESYMDDIYGKVLKELTSSLNFTLKIVSKMHKYGRWNRQNQTWSGMIGEVVSNRADFAVADLSMTSFRRRYVDFTLPLIVSRQHLYIKEPGICGVKWLGYFQTFNSCTWITIITLIAIAPLLLSFMKMYRESRSIMDLISENFICIWGIFCQQGLIEFPKRTSLRVAYLTIFLTAVLIMAHYSAALVCFLTACTRVLPFQTIDEFIDDGTYKLIVIRSSSEYDILSFQAKEQPLTKPFSVKLMKLMKDEQELPETIIDGFMQVCQERKVVFMLLKAQMKSEKMKIPCKVLGIYTDRIENLGMVLSKHSPYTGVINYYLQKFLNNGMIMRLRDTRFLWRSDEDKTYMPVRFINVIPILVILCGGIVISIAVLIVERIHYRSKRKKFQSKVFYPSRKLFIKK